MKRFRTLRVRFALWTSGLLLVMVLALGTFLYLSLRQGLLATVDTSLRLSASQAIAALNIENGQINFDDSIAEGSGLSDLRERGLTIRLLDPQGNTMQSAGQFHALPVNAPSLAAAQQQEPTFATVSDAAMHEWVRLYTASVVDGRKVIAIVQVGESLATVEEALSALLTALLVGGSLLIVVAAFGGFTLAARALAPIDHITRTARRISAEDLSARLGLPSSDDEVGRLAATLDTMLERLDDSFRRERRFTADASHELRTPLTAMQMILGVIRARRRTPEDYEQALADLSEEVDRLHSLVEDLLRLARGGTPGETARHLVDLSGLLGDISDSLRPMAENKSLTLTCTVPDGLELEGDSDSLIRLFANVLDNAVKYTERGGVVLRAESVDGELRVEITDTGLGIPAEHLLHVFERFYRVESERTSQGAGLGLAIAMEIARAHGGTIEVDSKVGEGTIFLVRLPALPSPDG